MNSKVIITCAVTGAGDTVGKHPAIPVTPEQIANACLEAASAGAAAVHVHVRDPKTGAPSRGTHLYAEVMERVRAKNKELIINLTGGMGCELEVGAGETPLKWGEHTNLVGPLERLCHVKELRPDIASLDVGTFNIGDGNVIAVETSAQLRQLAGLLKSYGVKPEIECFDSGHLWFAKQLIEEGLIEGTPFFQFCLGIRWGAPFDTENMAHLKAQLPPGAVWSGFSIGKNQMPAAIQSVLLGGHIRVGLEDNLWLDKGVYASNGSLVERARKLVRLLGSDVATPREAREILKLSAR